jgi:tRNA threonylcarbamoyladenosine biosynthesis protein TsaE
MATYISHSPDETCTLGEAWGRTARSGLVIAISGDLGAGKTQLAKGIARGLAIPGRVHSPTFALVNEYRGGRLPLFHVDLYRLDTPEQIFAAGLEEYFHPEGVSIIEWAERWFRNLSDFKSQAIKGALLRRVQIETSGENERRINYEDFGD